MGVRSLVLVKEHIANELLCQVPTIKANAKNKTVPKLMELRAQNPIVDHDDLDFFKAEHYRMTIVIQTKLDQDDLEKNADKHSRADKMVSLKFIALLTSNEDILAMYRRHTDTKSVTETDYRNSDKAAPDWRDLMCIAFNESDEPVMTELKPSLYDEFKEQIECVPNENFILTPKKCDDIMSTMKKIVRAITNKYNLSGNGSDMAVLMMTLTLTTRRLAKREKLMRLTRRWAQRRGITLIDGNDRRP